MNDLISRQGVLDKAYAYGNGLEPEGFCVDVEDIQALPSVELEQRWIPVTEQLPKPNEYERRKVRKYYLVQNVYGDMMVASYRRNTTGKTWWEQMYANNPVDDEVVAWMPLPEPYEKRE